VGFPDPSINFSGAGGQLEVRAPAAPFCLGGERRRGLAGGPPARRNAAAPAANGEPV